MYAIQLAAVNPPGQSSQIRLSIATSGTMSYKDAFFKQENNVI